MFLIVHVHLFQEIMDLHECFFSVIIVRIDDNERFMDQITAGKHSLTGPPWFFLS